MSGSKEDDDKQVRDNAGMQFRPANVATPGLGPRGSVGTGLSSYEKNALVNDIYVREGDKLVGPYVMVNTQPGQYTQEKAPPQQVQDNSGKVHFHETPDAVVNEFHAQRGEIMVPDPELSAAREQAMHENDRELERLHDMAVSGNHQAELEESREREHEHDHAPEDYHRPGGR